MTKDDVVEGTTSDTPISKRVHFDSLGRARINLDPNFGRWEYIYDDVGQLVQTISPTGNTATYTYDKAGRQTSEIYNGDVESQYFYDIYPGDDVLGLTDNPQWEGYPAYAVTMGGLVAIKDKTGITIAAANRGTRSETWRLIEPSDRLYHFETRTNWAGELIWSENPDGDRSTIEYYDDGVFKSSYFNGRKIIDDVRVNMHGQTELVRYADAAQTVEWTGYDPVTHMTKSTVVQQQNRVYEENGPSSQVTLMAFGYQYDAVGKLTGIADWRGRGVGETARLDLDIQHPATANAQQYGGYQQSAFPSSFDTTLAGPMQWNNTDVVSNTVTGWPVGATPSDVVLGYDTLYQLTEETREYITNNGVDSQLDEEYNTIQERVRTLDWKFDPTGSMTEWLDGEDSAGNVSTDSLGRALGTIKNGFQLNVESGNETCMNALADGSIYETPTGCYKPEAIYFASNVNDVNDASEPGSGRGTCIWARYDSGGRMTQQVVRTGCLTCQNDNMQANCPGAPEVGAPGQPGYKRAVEAKTTTYDYSWNALDQLSGAIRNESDSSEQLVMSYYYDATGARIIREKSSTTGGDSFNIRQDLYISGDYERRQVQLALLDDNGNPVPTTVNDTNFSDIVRGVFNDIEDTRLVKYSSGVRVDRDWSNGAFGEEKWFLKFGNHLGSTTVVTDFDTGDLVEWRTNYTYGADESHWKNGDEKYSNSEDPYGFTGKEEDVEVGLHYFGARYYSAYLGRWLSPDPPVVHQGGVTNLYNYGGNSPYIYVDPDGNFVGIIIGAVVGFAVAMTISMVQGEDIETALISGIIGGVAGAITGGVGAIGAGTLAGMVVGAATAALSSMAQTMIQGGPGEQLFISGVVSFAAGMVGGGMGAAMSGLASMGRAIAGYFSSMAVSYVAASATGALNRNSWDDIFFSSSLSYWGSYVGSVVGGEIQSAGLAKCKEGNETVDSTPDLNDVRNGSNGSSQPAPDSSAASPKSLPEETLPHGNQGGQDSSFDTPTETNRTTTSTPRQWSIGTKPTPLSSSTAGVGPQSVDHALNMPELKTREEVERILNDVAKMTEQIKQVNRRLQIEPEHEKRG